MARLSLEMAKKSVGDLTEADLKGKRCVNRSVAAACVFARPTLQMHWGFSSP